MPFFEPDGMLHREREHHSSEDEPSLNVEEAITRLIAASGVRQRINFSQHIRDAIEN